ncbi:homoprotocatechuate degradation operon regulator HpaR [Undibacterium sp. SXout7W]|uniref:homoprotocatechuate degradation operon regulator HpaR n=1 Tax=Undibacterium sp. SXout7W TaxID=3413049 RepID=UPI003BF003C9
MKNKIANRNLPQLFLRARASLMAHFRPILSHFGLTDQQWRILRLLAEHQQLEPRELCELSQILSPSMAGVLTRMEEIDLIHRNPMEGDQRRVLVSLSPHGTELMTEIAPMIDSQYQHIEKSIGKQGILDLIQELEEFITAAESSVQQVDIVNKMIHNKTTMSTQKAKRIKK